MADNVDGLVIELESGASEVGSQLDALTAKLEGLKKTVGSSTPLKTFSRNYQTLIDTINNSTGIDTAKLEGLRAFTQVMSNMNGIKISSSIATQLNNLDFVVQHLSGESLDGLYAFISAMSELNRLQGVSISASFVKNLQALADFASKIQGQNFSSLNELTTALANLAPLANADTASIKGLTTSVRTLSNTTRTASSRGRTFNTVLANIRTRTLLLVRATQTIRRMTTQAIGVYGDYVETLNLFKMAMGGAGQEAYEFAEKAQALLGIDLTQWMKAQGVFNALASGFGVASDRAAIMSKNLTQLAYDISSFYNIDVDTAVEKVRSGFSGQIRPVRDLGYDLSQARLEAIALSLGIDKTVKSMTQAEKSQLRYIALMTQLKQVQGDLSRTLDSPINQMRILQAQLQQMYRSIGMTLLPILNKVLPYLNAILRVIKMIADEIAAMFGYTLPKITSGDWSASVVSGAEDIEDELEEATGAAEKLKNTLAGFDQINLISSKSGGSGSGAGVDTVSGGFDFELPEYDFLGDAVENKAQQIADNMMKAIRPFVDFLKDSIKWTVDHIDDIAQLIEMIAIITIGKNLISKIKDTISWFKELNNVVGGLVVMTIGFQFSYLGGKDIAQGDILKGLLKSTIGAAVSAIGGYWAFGSAGLTISLVASLFMSLKGYFDEKEKQKVKQMYDSFFGGFKDYKTNVDDFKEAWDTFTQDFYNPTLAEKQSAADSLKGDVEEIGNSIATLQEQYRTGTVTGITYANNLTTVYERAEKAIRQHIDGVNQALEESLNGPLGLWMEAHGVSIEKLKNSFKNTGEEIIKEIERNTQKMQEYQHQYEVGQISIEEYEKKVNPLIEDLKKYYDITGMNTEATSNFLKQFSNIVIDFSDFDQVYETLENVSKGYEDAKKSIEELEKADVGNLEARLPFASDEDKKIIEEALKQTKAYYENQKQLLKDGYQSVLKSFEETGTINWMSAFNKEGLNDTIHYLTDDMLGFEATLSEIYGKEGIARNNTYWDQLIVKLQEYRDFESAVAKNSKGNGDTLNRAQKTRLNEMSSDLNKFTDKYKLHLLEQRQATQGLSEVERKLYKELRKELGLTSETFGDYVNDNSYYESLYTDAAKKEMKNRMYYYKEGQLYFAEETERTAATYYALANVFGDKSVLAEPLYKTIMTTADVMSSSSVTNAFDKGAYGLMNEVTGVFGKSRDNIQRAYNMALTPTGNTIVDIGVGIGEKIKEGMLDGAGFAKQGAEGMTKGMAQAFNVFGEKVYDYFMEIGNLGKTLLGGTGLQFGTATFNNTYKVPKIKGYATGGFPDSADFFYANENGVPEYVGSIGGRTAVATNTDIVKGVSDGVYRAITSTGIQNDVKKIASKNGKVVFAPSEEAGKVMSQSVNMYNGAGGRY